MKLSIIICAYNEELFIEGAVLAIIKQIKKAEDIELIIIDNESSDGTFEIIETLLKNKPKDNYRLLRISHVPLWVSRNVGLAEATGEYVFYLDGDGEVQDGWLEAVEEAVCNGFDIFCGAVCCHPDASMVESDIFNTYYAPSLASSKLPIIGANMGFRRKALLNVGGFEYIPTPRGDESRVSEKLSILNPRTVVVNNAVISNKYPSSWFGFYRVLVEEGKYAGFSASKRGMLFLLGQFFIRTISVIFPLLILIGLPFVDAIYLLLVWLLVFIVRNYGKRKILVRALKTAETKRSKFLRAYYLSGVSTAQDIGFMIYAATKNIEEIEPPTRGIVIKRG